MFKEQNFNETLISTTVKILDYKSMEQKEERKNIVEFIKQRFIERYFTPLCQESNKKNGFCTMAVCCLMIEALESFRRGWNNSKGNSELAFCSFFDSNDELKDFHGKAHEFYIHIRCGILHQAETTGGWHIRRRGKLLYPLTKTINATKFYNILEKCLDNYCNELLQAEWNAKIWKNFRKKMKAIIKNCQS